MEAPRDFMSDCLIASTRSDDFMNVSPDDLLRLRDAIATVRNEYRDGGVTRLGREHTTGERVLPWLVTAHVAGGGVALTIGDKTFRVLPGEAICIAPGVRHGIEKIDRRHGVSRWSHTNFWLFGTLDLCALLNLPPLLRGDVAARLGAINSEMAALNDAALAARKSGAASTRALNAAAVLQNETRRQSLLFSLLETLLMVASPNARLMEAVRGANRLAPALERIETHFSEPLSRDELARLVHLSPSRFTALFSAATGVAPGEYVVRRRLREAQQLLLHTDWPVGEIGARCGYADAFHFSRIFKQRNGKSPLLYRQTSLRSAL